MPTIRDNVVVLQSDQIEAVEFAPGTLTVTNGQPFEPVVKLKKHGDVTTLLVKAGRKKTKSVANQFNSWTENQGYASQGSDASSPKELNFCFKVKVTWKDGETDEVAIGQGSYFVRNNWWIGTNNLDAYTVSGKSLEAAVDASSKQITEKLPEIIQGLIELVGPVVYKQLLGSVNVFVISKK